jgi:hypothetical protein
MTRRKNKPTSFKERLQQAVPAMSPEARDALVELVSPEMKQAFRELAQRFQGEQTSETPASPPQTTTSLATPPKTARPRRGEQTARTTRVLRRRYPPDGKVPLGITAKAARKTVSDGLVAERKAGLAPPNEEGWPDPSEDVVGDVMKTLGRGTS